MHADPDPLLLDSSAAIALLVEDHDAHAVVRDGLAGRRLGLSGHAWFETYSVLTRLPGAQRRSPEDALRLLSYNFPVPAFLGETQAAELGAEIVGLGITGGAVYDALVGAAARQHRLRLVSSDSRARPIYDALGVDVEVISARS